MTLRAFVFESCAPVLETTGQRLAAVCACGELVPSVGPDDSCPRCQLVRWVCLRVLTYAGPIYIAADDERRAAFDVDGRVVFSQREIEAALPRLAALDPFDRYRELCAACSAPAAQAA